MQEENPSEETQIEASSEAAAKSKLTRRAFVKGALVVVGGAGLGLTGLTFSGHGTPALAAAADKPTLYMVATAHIDSQWNWTVQHVIEHCIPNTMQPNWALFEKYPAYSFNFEGVIHYMWFKEYHPEAWPELQSWVKKGRWKLSGSWINAVDVVNPSPESLFRQALYGQQFFRQEFGQVSNDIYLPDCFGFPYSLPTIGRHSGLLSFSTQKFDLWGGWFPSPFSVGRWEGADGSELVTALRPGSYNHDVHTDAGHQPAVERRHGERRRQAGRPALLRHRRPGRNTRRYDRFLGAARGRRYQCPGAGHQHQRRPDGERFDARRNRRPAALQRRADHEDARGRRLHVPGSPQKVEPDERADGGRRRTRVAGRRLAGRSGLPAAHSERSLGARAVEPVSRHHARNAHSAGRIRLPGTTTCSA